MNERGPYAFFRSTNAWLFDARCDGGANSIEIRVHADFTEAEAASAAEKYGKAVGRLPKVLRSGIGAATGIRILDIHKGHHSWHASSRLGGISIYTGSYGGSRGKYIEEVLVHEAGHTSLDDQVRTDPKWLAAQTTDGAFISQYAQNFSQREDVAESFAAYLAARFRPSRISRAWETRIFQAIPNRIAYFDTMLSGSDMTPFSKASPGLAGLVAYDDSLSVNADGAVTYDIRLLAPPDASVTVTPASGDATVATVSGPLTFTTRNWHIRQTVTVTGGASGATSISHTTASSDGDYNITAATLPNISVTVKAAGTLPVFDLAATGSVTEGGGKEITITLRGSLAQSVTLPALVASGEGIDIGDFEATNTTSWSTGDRTKKKNLRTLDDDEDEPTEIMTVVFEGRSFPDGAQPGTRATVKVLDNDPTTVTLSGTGDVVEGGAKFLTLALGRALVSGEALSVPLTFGGTADRGSSGDYALACGSATGVTCAGLDSGGATVTFTGPSARAVTLELTANVDSVDENAGETASIGLGMLDGSSGTGLGGGARGIDRLADFRILESSGKPTVSLTMDQAEADEGAVVAVTAILSKSLDGDVHIPLAVSQTSTADAADFHLLSPGITVRAGSTSGSVQLSFTDDAVDEPPERLVLALGTLPPEVKAGAVQTATVAIRDNDPTRVTISAIPGGGVVRGGTKTLTLALGRQLVAGEVLEAMVYVAYGSEFASNAPSKHGWADYQLACENPLPTGVSCPPLNRYLQGWTETFAFTGPSAASLDLTLTAHPSRGRDKERVGLYLSSPNESSGTNLDGGAVVVHRDLRFNIHSAAASPMVSLSVGAGNPSEERAARTFVTEGDQVTATISLSRALSKGVSYALSRKPQGSTATILADFRFAGWGGEGRIYIPAGETEGSTVITTIDDTKIEGNETIVVRYTQQIFDSYEVAEIVIVDNDHGAPEIGIAPWLPVTEGGKAGFTLTASQVVETDTTVRVTVAEAGGGNFVASGDEGSKTVTIPRGAKTTTFAVDTVNDGIAEGDSHVTVSVAADTSNPATYVVPANAPSASVRVMDDDAPGVVVMPTSLSVPMGGEASYAVALRGTPAGAVTVSVSVASGASHAQANPASLTFTPSNWSEAQPVKIAGLSEGMATFAHAVTTGDGGNYGTDLDIDSIKVTVTEEGDNPVSLSVSGNGAIAEGGTALTVTATLGKENATGAALAIPVQVRADGTTATAGDDYTLSGTISIPDGANSGTTDFEVVDDSDDEPGESVVIELGSPLPSGIAAGATDHATVAITDNDPTTVALTVPDTVATEGSASDTARINLALNRGVFGDEVLAVPLAFSGGTEGTDFTLALDGGPEGVTLGDGTVTFSDPGSGATATEATVLLSALADSDTTSGTVTVSLDTLSTTRMGGGATGSRTGDGEITLAEPAPGPVLPAAHPLVKYADLVKTFYDRITARHRHGDDDSGKWKKRFLKAMGHPEYVDYPQAAVTVQDARRRWNRGGPRANTAWNGTVKAVIYAERYFAGQVLPEVTIAADAASVTEGTGASFTLTATPPPAAPLEVTVTVAASGEFGITAGKKTYIIPTIGSYALTLATDNDGADETDGSVTATVDAGDGYTVGTASSGTVAIEDDDAPAPVLPGDHPLVKYASLVKSFYDRITARHVHGDSASGGWNKRFLKAMGHPEYVDYPQAAVTVADARRLWNHGGPGANTAWDGTVDAVTYAEQYFAGQVPTPTAQQQQQQVADPEVTIAAGAGIAEGGSATFVLTADPVPAAPLGVTVTVATEGAFGITAGERTVTIPTTGSYTLTLATDDDGSDEPNGSVTATVAAGTGYTVGTPSSGSVAIADDDVPDIEIAAGADVTEGTAASFVLTATPSPATALEVTVTIAASGDYGITAGERTVTIPTTGTYTLTLATDNDGTDEPNGSVSATLNAGTGYTVGTASTGTVAIADDDLPPPAVSVAAGSGVIEGGDAVFTVTADRAVDADLAVTLTVSEAAGSDFVAAADEGAKTVTILAGKTSATLTVKTEDDRADEPDGSVTATLAAGSGYTVASSPKDAASVAVADNDAAGGTLPVLSVESKSVQEGDGKVTLWATIDPFPSKADFPEFYRTTRLKLSTIEGTAWDGVDYVGIPAYFGITEACNFHTTLAPNGKHGCRIDEVTILDDSHDDGGETFQIEVGFADREPARLRSLGAARGTITIENSDPLPAAYLARFGRTVAEQALDGIAGRMSASRTPGMQGTVAGQALDFGPAATPGALADGEATLAMADIAQGLEADAAAAAEPFATPSLQSRSMTMHEALLGSSFSLTGEMDGTGGTMAFWGRASQASFDGAERGDGTDIGLDGTVTTGMLGADYARNTWLVGLALTQSSSEGSYAAIGDDPCPDTDEGLCDGAVRAGDGDVEASLTAAVPYAALKVSERLKLWGAAGHGAGEVTLKTMDESYRADTSWTMAAAGVRGDLLEGPVEGSGPALALTSDALWARTTSEKTGDLAATDSGVTRLRLGLEGSYRVALDDGGSPGSGSGASLTPKLEIGARHDGGDTETGFGVEVGGGIMWVDPGLGLSLDVSGRTLLAHENGDLEDRGVSASLAFDPAPASARGPSFGLRQDFGGQAQGGLDALFASAPLEDRTGSEATSRWAMEAAYGFPAFGGFYTGSPHVGLGLSTGARDYSVGWRLTPEAATAPDLSFGLRATRRESDTQAAEHTVGFEITARW